MMYPAIKSAAEWPEASTRFLDVSSPNEKI